MKKVVFIFVLFILVSRSYGQLGSRYFHCDTLVISTAQYDTTWSVPWEQVFFYSLNDDIRVKIGAPDVGSWSSRNWMYLPPKVGIVIGPSPRLKKLSIKSTSGTDTVYVFGYKKERQY